MLGGGGGEGMTGGGGRVRMAGSGGGGAVMKGWCEGVDGDKRGMFFSSFRGCDRGVPCCCRRSRVVPCVLHLSGDFVFFRWVGRRGGDGGQSEEICCCWP